MVYLDDGIAVLAFSLYLEEFLTIFAVSCLACLLRYQKKNVQWQTSETQGKKEIYNFEPKIVSRPTMPTSTLKEVCTINKGTMYKGNKRSRIKNNKPIVLAIAAL